MLWEQITKFKSCVWKKFCCPCPGTPPDLPRILQLQWNLEGYHDTQVLRSCFTESFDYQDRL